MRKKIWGMVVILTVFMMFVPYTAHAKNLVKFGDLTFDTDTGTITFCNREATGNIEIPDEINGIKVKGIEKYAFASCGIESVNIPDSVTWIENGTFQFCTNLKSITLSNNITGIGISAFEGCVSLSNIDIPMNVTFIGDYAFMECAALNSINIPNGVTHIGDRAFGGCTALKSAKIPKNVEYIGWAPFSGCESLTSIDVDRNNPEYTSDNGVLFNADKTHIVQYPAGKKDSIYSIPDSVISIGYFAFERCNNLASINIPKSVVEIGYDALAYCTNLTNIFVDSKNENFCAEEGVLFNKNKTKLIQYPIGREEETYNIPAFVNTIGVSAFAGSTSITYMQIKNNITRIYQCAFCDCPMLTMVSIPDSVSEIELMTFMNCKSLKTINLPEHIELIESYAFYNTAFFNDKNNWDNGVLYLDNYLLCASEDVPQNYRVKDGTTLIADSAFHYQELNSIDIELNSIYIPNSIKFINQWAFSDGIDGATDVYYGGTEAQWNNINIERGNESLTNAEIHFNSQGYIINNTPVITSADVSAENGEYEFVIELEEVSDKCKLIAILYDDEKTTGMAIEQLRANDSYQYFTVAADSADTAKIFIWDSLSGMRPLCEAKTIPIE